MAVVSTATLKGYFNTGDTPTESQYVDLIDTLAALPSSSGGAPTLENNTANGASCDALYFGSGTITFTESATAEYTLDFGSGTIPSRVVLTFDSDNWDGSGNMTVVLTTSGGYTLYPNMELILNDGTRVSDPKGEFSIAATHTITAGSTIIALTNVNNIGSSGGTLIFDVTTGAVVS